MTFLSKAAFIAKYNDATEGLYKAGQDHGIGSDDHRSLVDDLKDSVLFLEDFSNGSPGIWKSTYIRAKTVEALPDFTFSSVDGIVQLTANGAGALPSIDGRALNVGDSIMVSEESTAFYNGVYTVENKGNIPFSRWRLKLRDDSNTGIKTTKAIYFVKEGVVNGNKYFRQDADNSAGSIANIDYIEVYLSTGNESTKETSFLIASAGVLTMNSVPYELLPAPGSGKALVIESFVAILKFETTPYATNTKIELFIGATSLIGEVVGFLDSVGDKVIMYAISIQDSEIDQPLTVQVNDGDPTDGDSNVRFLIKYKIIQL